MNSISQKDWYLLKKQVADLKSDFKKLQAQVEESRTASERRAWWWTTAMAVATAVVIVVAGFYGIYDIHAIPQEINDRVLTEVRSEVTPEVTKQLNVKGVEAVKKQLADYVSDAVMQDQIAKNAKENTQATAAILASEKPQIDAIMKRIELTPSGQLIFRRDESKDDGGMVIIEYGDKSHHKILQLEPGGNMTTYRGDIGGKDPIRLNVSDY